VTASLDGGAAQRFVGERVPRVEDGRLVTGRGTFVDDVTLPGLLHATFVRSPHARARIVAIDTAAAQALDGVRVVFTAADLNHLVKEQWHNSSGRHSPDTPRPPLAEDEVRFVGDPVVLVLARDRYVAEDAADLVVVDYDPLPPVMEYDRAEHTDARVHAAHAGGNVVGGLDGPPADNVDAAFSSSAHVVEATFWQQRQTQAPMETRGLVVRSTPGLDEVTIWASTQTPHNFRSFCARLLGIPEYRVRVIMRDTGGGFGQKVYVQRDEMSVVLASAVTALPVKWIEDRQENLLAAGQSRHEHGHARLAFDDGGRICGARLDFVSDVGAYPSPWPVGSTQMVGGLFPGPYRVPHATFSTKCMYTNTVGRTPYRGPWQFETLSREVLLDIAARELGIDPAELRRRNLLRGDEIPYVNPNGMSVSCVAPLETYEQALSMLGYDAFRAEQAEARAQGRYIGVGTSTYVEPTSPAFGMYGTEGATIRIEPSGIVNVYVGGGAAGNSVETTVVQLAADALGADIADVNTVQGDTAVTPYGGGAVGSRSASMTAGAIDAAARIVREQLRALAAHKLEAAIDDVELSSSRASVAGSPAVSVTFGELADMAYHLGELPAGVPPGLEASARYGASTPMVWAAATHLCTCEVDTMTGQVRLLRYIVSEDCGRMINPSIVEGQIAGGTAQGIAGALYERLEYDEDGNPITTTYLDYLVPTTTEIPTVEYGHVSNPGVGPGGFKGVGEGGAIGAPAAVVNAVADALAPFGARITELPLTPDRIVQVLDLAESGRHRP
jgi:carbon-monoxide dehydrogenase large subunit